MGEQILLTGIKYFKKHFLAIDCKIIFKIIISLMVIIVGIIISTYDKIESKRITNQVLMEFYSDSINGVISAVGFHSVKNLKGVKSYIKGRDNPVYIFLKVTDNHQFDYKYFKAGDSIWKKPNDVLLYSKRGSEIIKWEAMELDTTTEN